MTFVGLRPSRLRRRPLPICSQPSRFGAMSPFRASPRRRRTTSKLSLTSDAGVRQSRAETPVASVAGLRRPERPGATHLNGRMPRTSRHPLHSRGSRVDAGAPANNGVASAGNKSFHHVSVKDYSNVGKGPRRRDCGVVPRPTEATSAWQALQRQPSAAPTCLVSPKISLSFPRVVMKELSHDYKDGDSSERRRPGCRGRQTGTPQGRA